MTDSKCMVAMQAEDITLEDAAIYLTTREQQHSLQLQGKRQQLWLKGRLAAKRAIQGVIEKNLKQRVSFSSIEIRGDRGERPSFRLLDAESGFVSDDYCLTISHTDDRAVATLSVIRHDGYVGIDIERARYFSQSFAQAFLTDREYDQALHLGQTYMLQCWCYKEAYLKAVGIGLRLHPRRIETVFGTDHQLVALKQDGVDVPMKAQALVLPGMAFGAIVYAQSYEL